MISIVVPIGTVFTNPVTIIFLDSLANNGSLIFTLFITYIILYVAKVIHYRERSDILHSNGDIQHLTGYQLAVSCTLILCHLHQIRNVPSSIATPVILTLSY